MTDSDLTSPHLLDAQPPDHFSFPCRCKVLKKPRFDLVPAKALYEVARLLANSEDAGHDRFRKDGAERVLGSLMRHIEAYRRGEINDSGSGRHALAHAAARALQLLELELEGSRDVKQQGLESEDGELVTTVLGGK